MRLRYRLSAMAADAYAAEGWTCVLQDVVIGPELGSYVRLVRTRPLYVVVLAPDGQAVATREAGRAKSGYRAGWTVEALDRVLREETPRIGLWLDSSRQTPQETVDVILAGLDRARSRTARTGGAAVGAAREMGTELITGVRPGCGATAQGSPEGRSTRHAALCRQV